MTDKEFVNLLRENDPQNSFPSPGRIKFRRFVLVVGFIIFLCFGPLSGFNVEPSFISAIKSCNRYLNDIRKYRLEYEYNTSKYNENSDDSSVDENSISNKYQLELDKAYEILGVTKNATDEEIRAVYKKLALKYHPDKNQGDPLAAEAMIKLNAAYSVIKESRGM